MKKKEKKRLKKAMFECIDISVELMKKTRPDCNLMTEIANLASVLKKL